MPIYVYQEILEGGQEGSLFEVEQPMSAPLLTHHPITGRPVRRVYQAPNLTVRYTPGRTKALLDNKNLEKAGFTRYEKDKLTGTYHKTAGTDSRAPDVLRPS